MDQKIGKMDRHCREKNVQSLVGIYYLHRSELPLGEKIVITERACHILGRFHIKGWTQKKKITKHYQDYCGLKFAVCYIYDGYDTWYIMNVYISTIMILLAIKL